MAIQQPVTEDAFFATRMEFFHGFIKFATYATVAVLCVVALMGIFLG
jgi:hypothetical protein